MGGRNSFVDEKCGSIYRQIERSDHRLRAKMTAQPQIQPCQSVLNISGDVVVTFGGFSKAQMGNASLRNRCIPTTKISRSDCATSRE